MSLNLGEQIAGYIRSLIPASDLSSAIGSDEREAWRQRYWSDPVLFARDHYRWHNDRWLAAYQQDILRRLHTHKRVAAYGPRSFGKTATVAHACLHFCLTRDGFTDWKIPTTAGGYRQLEKYLWPELHKWARLLRWDKLWRKPFSRRDELMKLSLEGETGSAFAVASDDAALIEGAHATQMLFIFDESKSIPDSVFDSVEGMLAGAGLDDQEAYLLATSSPGDVSGRFWAICDRQEKFADWDVREVRIEEAIAARRVSADWAQKRMLQWGYSSTLFQNHVLGRFASAASDGVIPSFWVEEAQARGPQEARGPADGASVVNFGVDVSRGGRNETVIAVRRGWAIIDLIAWQDNDTLKVVKRVKEAAAKYRPAAIIIDAVGVGAGVFDVLRDEDFPVVSFHGGEAAPGPDSTGEVEFLNFRAWAWWHLRELLNPHGPVKLSLPEDRVLLTHLTVGTYSKVGDRLKLESKEEIEKRLRKLNPNPEESCSPDRGDAVVMCFSDDSTSNFATLYTVHTAASLAVEAPRLQGLPTSPVALTPTAATAAFVAREQWYAAQQAAREKQARPLEQQLDSLLWQRAHRNHDVWNQD
jgi:hypothetical protein